jgi:hypothetical protein
MVLADNPEARRFWERVGWQGRPEVDLMSFTISGDATA